MKIEIYSGEAFPVYQIYKYTDDNGWPTLEVDGATLEKWRQAFETFSKVQEEIIQELEKQGKSDKIWYGGSWEGFHL